MALRNGIRRECRFKPLTPEHKGALIMLTLSEHLKQAEYDVPTSLLQKRPVLSINETVNLKFYWRWMEGYGLYAHQLLEICLIKSSLV